MAGVGPANRPRVRAPLPPAKKRPRSRGSERQGVTPIIVWGVLRSRPSSPSLLTQPLNRELLTATWGHDAPGVRSQGCWGGGLVWLGWGPGGEAGQGQLSPGACGCAGCREEDPPQRGCGAGGPQPPGAACQSAPGSGPRPRSPPAGPERCPTVQTPGGGQGSMRRGWLRAPPASLPLSPLPGATGLPDNAGGSEP